MLILDHSTRHMDTESETLAQRPVLNLMEHRTVIVIVFFSSRRRHTRCLSDWSSDVCSSDPSRRWHTICLSDWSSDVCSSDLYSGPGGAVIIPSIANGWPVTSIGDSAFESRSDVTSVTIPPSGSDARRVGF